MTLIVWARWDCLPQSNVITSNHCRSNFLAKRLKRAFTSQMGSFHIYVCMYIKIYIYLKNACWHKGLNIFVQYVFFQSILLLGGNNTDWWWFSLSSKSHLTNKAQITKEKKQQQKSRKQHFPECQRSVALVGMFAALCLLGWGAACRLVKCLKLSCQFPKTLPEQPAVQLSQSQHFFVGWGKKTTFSVDC